MVSLRLENILPRAPGFLHGAPWYQISGDVIRRGPQGVIVAEYVKHSWEMNGQYFTAMCETLETA